MKTDERQGREKGSSGVAYTVNPDDRWFDVQSEGGSTQPGDQNSEIAEGGSAQPAEQNSEIAEGGLAQPAEQNSELAEGGSAPPADQDPEAAEADQVCIHEGGELYVEGMEDQMAVLPEVTPCPPAVTIDDLQVGDPDVNTPEEIGRLKDIIWKRRHLLIGPGNALPPAAHGAVCDVDVGGA